MSIEEITFPHDPARSHLAGVVGPFRLAGGRLIVDAHGRIVARAEANRAIVETSAPAISPTNADGNSHAIAAMLNRQPDDSVDTCRAMLSLCAVQSDNLEFWHRLAGSIRKAITLIG